MMDKYSLKDFPTDLFPPSQVASIQALFEGASSPKLKILLWDMCAIQSLLGDVTAQRNVLELNVKFSEAGIEPSPIFKRASIAALKTALEGNKLPSRNNRGGQRKGTDGSQFQLAVEYWKEVFLRGERGANKRAAGLRNPKFVTEAVGRYGDLAKGKALLGLALLGEDAPNFVWWDEFVKFSEQQRSDLLDAMAARSGSF